MGSVAKPLETGSFGFNIIPGDSYTEYSYKIIEAKAWK